MFRKIVISVLVISASVIASAGIAELAGWDPWDFTWGKLSEGHEVSIGVSEGDLTVLYLFSSTDPHLTSVHGRMGFWYVRGEFDADCFLMVYCPFWIPVLLVAAYPILLLIKTIRLRLRHKPGHCSKCGYDLTGLPDPRCPECGTEFER